jgi:hypothetical protein
MSIFNKKRMGFVSKKGLYKYILYGLGEIILVVIGILIAVSINNRNERKASENRLKTYLQVYHQDVVQDTTVIGFVLKNLDERKEFFKLFLSDTVTSQDYIIKPQGYGLVLSYSPFKLQQKGANLLERFVDDSEKEQDTLISQILASHSAFDNLLSETNKRIGDDIDDNMNFLKNNQPWIADLLLGKTDHPDMMTYYLSDTYRARLAIHSTLVYGNLEPGLKAMRKSYQETLVLIEQRLQTK